MKLVLMKLDGLGGSYSDGSKPDFSDYRLPWEPKPEPSRRELRRPN
jgi:hypothetical protein